jgi:hypothetical protein
VFNSEERRVCISTIFKKEQVNLRKVITLIWGNLPRIVESF